MKPLRIALVVGIAALACLGSVSPASAAIPFPHQDPDTAQWVFDGASFLQKLSDSLSDVIAKNANGVKALQTESISANIPPDMRLSTDNFFAAGESLADLIPGIQAAMDSANQLLSQSRAGDARQATDTATVKLDDAYTELRAMDTSAADAGRWWNVDSAYPQGPLHLAYDDVQAKLASLRSLLDLLGKGISGETQQAEILNGATFSSTTLNLAVAPQSAFVGDDVQFSGTLTGSNRPMGGRLVTLLVNGAFYQVVPTDGSGVFGGSITLPYQYVPTLTVQAIYYPTGADLGAVLGCSSTDVTVNVLFYAATIALKVPAQVYPGKTLVLEGSIDYGNSPAPANRSLLVLWDDNVVAQQDVSQGFSIDLPVSPSETAGTHKVGVYAYANGRYAPAGADGQLSVTRIAPIIDVHTQGLLMLPASLKVMGTVRSQLGPPDNALVTVRLGDWQTTTRTSSDGSFEARLGTGLSLALVGAQQMSVEVRPEESWYTPSSQDIGLMVISPVNIILLVFALVVLAFFGLRWAMRRAAFVAEPVLAPVTIVEQRKPALKRDEKKRPDMSGRPGDFILALYREILRLVQNMTAVALGPNRTLREFAQECGPKLGPLSGYFRELTLLVERLLYSRHSPEQGDAARSKELGDSLKESLKSENT